MLLKVTVLPGDGIGPEVTHEAGPRPAESSGRLRASTHRHQRRHRGRGAHLQQRSSAQANAADLCRFRRRAAGGSRRPGLRQVSPAPGGRTVAPAQRTGRFRKPEAGGLLRRAGRLFAAAAGNRAWHGHPDRARVAWRALLWRTASDSGPHWGPHRDRHHAIRRAGNRAHRTRRLRSGAHPQEKSDLRGQSERPRLFPAMARSGERRGQGLSGRAPQPHAGGLDGHGAGGSADGF